MQLQNAVNYRGPLYPTFLGICRWCFGREALFAVVVLQRSQSLQLRWMELDSIAGFFGTSLLIIRRQTRIIGISLASIFLYFAAVTTSLEVESYRYRMVLDPCILFEIVCGLFGGQVRQRSKSEK